MIRSRRSKCPRSPAQTDLPYVLFFLLRRWQNSWWKCPLSPSDGALNILVQRMGDALVVEVPMIVSHPNIFSSICREVSVCVEQHFNVVLQDRVQQRCPGEEHQGKQGFLPGTEFKRSS